MPTASTILFVDDEKHETKYFKKALCQHFLIETADSVDAAITLLNEKHDEIAVVITDQRMPKQLGVELLHYTQTHYPHIVRMLTTAFCDFDSAVDAINKAEVFRYIPKPWDLDVLEDALHHALQRFHSLQKDSGSTLENNLITEMRDDCEHWLMYAIHAYGDENVYRSGIEALSCRYHILINSHFKGEAAKRLLANMDTIIADNFLSTEVLQQLNSQKDEGFGVSHSSRKTH